MKTIVSDNGQIEIPAEFLRADAVQPGQECEIQRVGPNEYRVHVQPSHGDPRNFPADTTVARNEYLAQLDKLRAQYGVDGEPMSLEDWESFSRLIAGE